MLERSLDEKNPSGSILLIRAQSLAALGRFREAAEAVQDSLKNASDRPHFAFQMALVYAMIGESNSALASMETALEKGMGPRWFNMSWFDPLRSHPEFQALLETTPGQTANLK